MGRCYEGEGEEMKSREIGQCKNCKWFVSAMKYYLPQYGNCKILRKFSMDITVKDFGCWYWKVKE
jgi:hypothetical protein